MRTKNHKDTIAQICKNSFPAAVPLRIAAFFADAAVRGPPHTQIERYKKMIGG